MVVLRDTSRPRVTGRDDETIPFTLDPTRELRRAFEEGRRRGRREAAMQGIIMGILCGAMAAALIYWIVLAASSAD